MAVPRETQLTRYHFVLQGDGESHNDRSGTVLPSDDAALAYAKRIVRELKEAGGYDHPSLKMIVKNSAGAVVHLVPF